MSASTPDKPPRPPAPRFGESEADRRHREALRDRQRGRLVDAAKVDPATLSESGRRILDWLADWDTPTIDGLCELITAARMGVYVACHRDDLDQKLDTFRDSNRRVGAALERLDERMARRPPEPPGPEL